MPKSRAQKQTDSVRVRHDEHRRVSAERAEAVAWSVAGGAIATVLPWASRAGAPKAILIRPAGAGESGVWVVAGGHAGLALCHDPYGRIEGSGPGLLARNRKVDALASAPFGVMEYKRGEMRFTSNDPQTDDELGVGGHDQRTVGGKRPGLDAQWEEAAQGISDDDAAYRWEWMRAPTQWDETWDALEALFRSGQGTRSGATCVVTGRDLGRCVRSWAHVAPAKRKLRIEVGEAGAWIRIWGPKHSVIRIEGRT